MTAFITKCVILAIIVTQVSCYTLVGPKMFGQSLSPEIWSDIYQYPIRGYRPSVPLPFLRYYGDAYYSPRNLQNRNYYLPHDSYDDSDYYSNILYYLPTSRSSSYFERAPVNPIEELPELPDYEDDSAEDDTSVSKPQRDWWLEKNVAANEDTDLSQLNRVDDLSGRKSAVSKTGGSKQNSKNSQQSISKSRYDGIDGFGRKKNPEDGTNRPNTRKSKEHPSVYGKPVAHQERHEDTDVRDLKSLLRGTPNTDDDSYADSILRRWEAGDDKRSGGMAKSVPSESENAAYLDDELAKMNNWWTATIPVNTFTIYDEGGKEVVPENSFNGFDGAKWKDYSSEQTSVFDTIKSLLALEDEVNAGNLDGKSHKLLKRKPPAYKPPVKNKSSNKDRSRNQGSTTEVIPTIASNESPSPVKRSAGAATAVGDTKSKSYHSNEDALVRELSAARRQNS